MPTPPDTMVDMDFNYLFDNFKKLGWQLGWSRSTEQLPTPILERLQLLPKEYLDFLKIASFLVNGQNTAWFLTLDDFAGTSDNAFVWNEFETMSLEWGAGYNDVIDRVIAFWQRHLPIAISVKSGYAYLALSLAPSTQGAVVYGREPTFENGQIIADDFIGILNLLVAESTDETPIYIRGFQ